MKAIQTDKAKSHQPAPSPANQALPAGRHRPRPALLHTQPLLRPRRLQLLPFPPAKWTLALTGLRPSIYLTKCCEHAGLSFLKERKGLSYGSCFSKVLQKI